MHPALEKLPSDHRTWKYADVPVEDGGENFDPMHRIKEIALQRFGETDPLELHGPWADEPDKVQWVDPATGLDCLIVRNRMGGLCGYVGVPDTHPYFAHEYDRLPVEVHGGLTFANFCTPGEPVIGVCHVPYEGRPDRVWWLGFDCGHSYDYQPVMGVYDREMGKREPDVFRSDKYFKAYNHAEALAKDAVADSFRTWPEVYRDLGYVINEVTQLAAQIAEVKEYTREVYEWEKEDA